jgi:hypothetical protein
MAGKAVLIGVIVVIVIVILIWIILRDFPTGV